MTAQILPPATYFGGKTRIAPRIAALFPKHGHYIELFGGSLAVLLAKPPSAMETVNDTHRGLMTFWRVLRDRPQDLERACALTPHSRAEHGDCDWREPGIGEVETARRVWVNLTQGRGAHLGRVTGWRYYQDPGGTHSSMPDYLAAYTGRMPAAAARLMRVTLECRPALELVALYGKHERCLLYADPPYPGLARWSTDKRYEHEMLSEREHVELADALRACKASVLISGYHSDLYDELYAGWHVHEINAFAGVGNGEERARLEVVWSNRHFPHDEGGLW
jgi:DNA adenine methylase